MATTSEQLHQLAEACQGCVCDPCQVRNLLADHLASMHPVDAFDHQAEEPDGRTMSRRMMLALLLTAAILLAGDLLARWPN